ncbi:helix-turn-helix domain-containing protein [Thauera sp.]|uniref:helix-turn-helix domain-containing protein n=1 Tax=Thauera sp. TaxID=1905334 RepID=UPI0039E49D1A
MNTTEYLAAAKQRIGAENSAEMATRLGVTRAAMSRYESGERVMDDYTAARIAEILEIDPLRVIAQANAEREKDEKRAAYWSSIAHAAMTAPSRAYANGVCIM